MYETSTVGQQRKKRSTPAKASAITDDAPTSDSGDEPENGINVDSMTDDEHDLVEKREKTGFEIFAEEESWGCDMVCCSCEGTFFRGSIRRMTPTLSDKIPERIRDCLLTATDDGVDGELWLCSTCYDYLRQKAVPPCSRANGLLMHAIPEPLQNLHSLEERLLCRIPFMIIRPQGRWRQNKLKSNVVNVVADVARVQTMMPRNLDDTETVNVALNRRAVHDHAHMAASIHPNRVLAALD